MFIKWDFMLLSAHNLCLFKTFPLDVQARQCSQQERAYLQNAVIQLQ